MTAAQGLQCGDVLSIFDYEFGDGSIADSKYFVVMGHHFGDICGFLTTSKAKGGRKPVEGCQIEFGNYPSNYYLKAKGTPFSNGTWVLLRIKRHNEASFLRKQNDSKAVWVCTLPDPALRALRNCFERSMDWAPICAEYMCGGK